MSSGEPLKLTGELDEPEKKDEPAKPKKKRGGDEPAGARQRRRGEGELRERLLRVFDRLAEWLEGRGDDELAKVIREDAGAMTGGLVSLTKPVAAVRAPLLVLVAIAEPLLAFGRVARILGGRLADRRARQAEQRAAEPEPGAWCTCGAGEYQPPELHVYPCPGSAQALAEAEHGGAGGG